MLSRLIKKIKIFFPSNTQKVFSSIYKNDAWKTKETISGYGSTLAYTANLRNELPVLLSSLEIKDLLDAPCGDYNWMSKVALKDIDYTGVDIVTWLIEKNKQKYPEVKFIIADIIKNKLPKADAVLCRDCFIHLKNREVIKAIRNFKRNGIKYLVTNTYPVEKNVQIITGYYRPVNLQAKPFNLPPPLKKINDYSEGETIRYLAVWLLDDISL